MWLYTKFSDANELKREMLIKHPFKEEGEKFKDFCLNHFVAIQCNNLPAENNIIGYSVQACINGCDDTQVWINCRDGGPKRVEEAEYVDLINGK